MCLALKSLPAKYAPINVACLSHLLHIFAKNIDHKGKQCRPRLDYSRAVSSGSTLFEEDASNKFQQRTKADDFAVIGAKYLGLNIL